MILKTAFIAIVDLRKVPALLRKFRGGSSCDSSMLAGVREQTHIPDL